MKKYILISLAMTFMIIGLLEILNVIKLNLLQNIIRFIFISLLIIYLTYNRDNK